MRPIGLAVLVAAALSASGCIGLLALDPGNETAVKNQSELPYVIEVVDNVSTRYFPLPSGAQTIVDTVGEMNAAAVSLTILDPNCSVVTELREDFDRGGLVTLADDAPPTFQPNRRGTGVYPEHAGSPTCEMAASSL